MSSNPITIILNDGIAPSIAPNLKAIETNARSADSSIQTLKQSLDNINAAGVGKLSKSISTISNSTAKLSTATGDMGARALIASTSIDKLSVSYDNLASSVLKAQTVVAASGAVMNTASTKAKNFGDRVRDAGKGAHGQVTDVMAASAAIRGLEGNFGTSVRAAERFLVTTMGLGPILRMAFPIFGALALAGVIDMLFENVQKLVKAYKALSVEARQAETDAIRVGERILKLKPEGFFTASNFARMLSMGPANKDISVQNAREALKELQWKRDIQVIDDQNLEKSKTGMALQKQKEISAKHEIEYNRQAQTAANKLADTYQAMLNAKVKVRDEGYDNVSGGLSGRQNYRPAKYAPVISDEKQVKAIQDQLRTASDAARDFGHEVDVATHKLVGVQAKEAVVGIKDELKAAHAQMKLFELEMGKLKQSDHLVTPQEKLALVNDQMKRAMSQNQPALESQKGTFTQEIERQEQAVAALTERWKDQVDEIGLYRDSLREAQAWNKIQNQLTKDGIVLTEDQTKALKDNVHEVVAHADYQRELKNIYNQFDSPQRDYMAKIEAINSLESEGTITTTQALQARLGAIRTYQNAVNPMTEYNENLKTETKLLGFYGEQAGIEAEIERVRLQLRNNNIKLSDVEETKLRNSLKTLQDGKIVQQEVNRLYEQYGDRLKHLALQQAAVSIAFKNQKMTAEQYRLELAKLRVEEAQFNVEMQKKTNQHNLLTTVFGNYIKDFEGFTKGTTKLYQNMFASIADGAADSLGRAIVFGESLSSALAQVARQALAELISGFIKLGIQMLITHFLGGALAHAAVAASAAQAGILAAAWAGPAALASLATLGQNAIPAAAALTGTVALASGIALLNQGISAGANALNPRMMATGGIVPGTGNFDSVHTLLTPGEGVLNKWAMSRLGTSGFNALNSGASVVRQNGASTGSGVNLNVQVVHDGSTAVRVVKTSENEIRVIARSEADRVVREKAPDAVAQAMHNPNSAVSKSTTRNFNVAPRR